MKNISLVLLIFLFSCATVQIYSDYDRTADFKKFKTFAWLHRSDSVHNYWYDNQLIEKNVKFYVTSEMKARGYILDINNPDLILEYHSTAKKEHYTVSNPIYSNQTNNNNGFNNNGFNNNGFNNNGFNNNGFNNNFNQQPYNPNRPYAYNNTPYVVGYNQQQVEYNEETLIIDVVDKSINQLIWRGWAVGSISDEQDLEEQLPNDIKKIFLKYPVPLPQTPKVKKRNDNEI
ncbi:MAG TPA: DUF4136 domain-containing protein [Cytophagaceae bacterium]|jgi:hypothetical protein|nr:DUF4136 domain-containing protein [Cytophagaceae bacterium]